MSEDRDTAIHRQKPWLIDYEKLDYRRVWEKKRLEDAAQKHVIRGWLKSGNRCLELGAGFGRITEFLEPYFKEVTALELGTLNLRIAKSRLKSASLVRSDIGHIPFGDSTFDTVAMIRVVQLLPQPRLVLREISRVAKDGATVILSMPNLATNNILWAAQSIWNKGRQVGPYVWPFDRARYFVRVRDLAPESMHLVKRRGTGLFDNPIGEALRKSKGLYLLDVATSPLWFMKLDILMKFEVTK